METAENVTSGTERNEIDEHCKKIFELTLDRREGEGHTAKKDTVKKVALF